MKKSKKTIYGIGMVVENTFFDSLLQSKIITNIEAVNALKRAKNLNHEIAVIAGQLHVDKGCIAISGQKKDSLMAILIAHSTLSSKGFDFTYWSISGNDNFRKEIESKLKNIAPGICISSGLH